MRLALVLLLALAFTTVSLVAEAPVASAGCAPSDNLCVLWCPPPPSDEACQIRSPIGPL